MKPHVLMFGGRLTFVQDWAAAAVASGADVTLVQRGPLREGFSVAPSESDGVGSATHPVPALRPSRYFTRPNGALLRVSLRRLIDLVEARSGRITHLHTHFYPGSDVANSVARERGLTHIHTEHSSAIITGRVSSHGKRVLQSTCEHADVVMAVSEGLAQSMRDLGVSAPIRVVPNPVALEMFSAAPLRAQLPAEADAGHFVTIGRLIELKNHSAILEALALVRSTKPRAHLSIIGAGPLLPDLKEQARRLGVADHVRFLGRVERQRVAEVLAAAHVYVHASRAETFGVALIEAWGAGLPVVSFDCGGVTPLADALGGRTVRGWDPEDLASAMHDELASTTSESREMIKARTRDRFDVAIVASELQRAYLS